MHARTLLGDGAQPPISTVEAGSTMRGRDRNASRGRRPCWIDSDAMLSDMAIRHADRLTRAECVLVGVRVAG
jgi:hypothetical protein